MRNIYAMHYLYSLLLLLVADVAMAQTLTWKRLSLPEAWDRYNDVWFVTPEIGWAILPSYAATNDGHIYKTTDGGTTWTDQYATNKHLRSVCFIDSLVGFVGFLHDGTSSPLLKTTDGGSTWVTAEVNGAMPFGICGMMRVDDSTVVGTGQVYGPAHFLRTTDRGDTWTSVSITSDEIDNAIDCYFWSRDSGIVVGGIQPGTPKMVCHIWQTTDGGKNWSTAYQGDKFGEWCWKISFPHDGDVGYVSIEDLAPDADFLKTTDRGKTWRRITVAPGVHAFQGIGFIDELRGWLGSHANIAYATTNGGETWVKTTALAAINRLRFFGDTLGYAAGKYVYKLTPSTSGVSTTTLLASALEYDITTESLLWSRPGSSVLRITDVLGRTMLQAALSSETQRFDVSELPSGVYIARLESGASLKFSR